MKKQILLWIGIIAGSILFAYFIIPWINKLFGINEPIFPSDLKCWSTCEHYGFKGVYSGGFLSSSPAICNCLDEQGEIEFKLFEGKWNNPNYCFWIGKKEYC